LERNRRFSVDIRW